MTHPDDPRGPSELPSYITSGSISRKTREKLVNFIAAEGYPEVVLSSTVVKKLGMDPGWANRALFHTGFRPGTAKNKKIGRPWYTPDEILALKDATPESVEDAPVEHAPAEVESMPVYDEPDGTPIPDPDPEYGEGWTPAEKVKSENGRDFIDEHDSWTLDLQNRPVHMSLGDWLNVLASAGLEYEIRVWRKR